MADVLFVAGLPVPVFDRLKQESSKRFVSDGWLIAKPLVGGPPYPANTALSFLSEAQDYVKGVSEDKPVSALLLYVDYKEASTDRFVRQFFPFCLSAPVLVPEFDPGGSTNKRNRQLNTFIDGLVVTSRRLRRSADAVKAALSGNNLTPLLLPIRNFSSTELVPRMEELFFRLCYSSAPDRTVADVCEAIVRRHPWARPPADSRRCLSDGVLYFKSPGSAQHGLFRHAGTNAHRPECIFNARSRLGGPFRHTFHYDCTPVRGRRLAGSYPNCHDEWVSPKPTHVNIAPSDFII